MNGTRTVKFWQRRELIRLCGSVMLGLGVSVITLASAEPANSASKSKPWWEDFPTIIQVNSAKTAAEAHATASLCGAADDPTWGLYGQRLRIASAGKYAKDLHEAGMKALTWIEAFGTCGSYIVQLKQNPDGSWVKSKSEPAHTQVFHSHWSWGQYDGSGLIRWVGPHNYFDHEDFAQPWTRSHPRYGCPPMTYPNGRIATGFIGAASDPRNSQILDAGCSKDILGRVTFEYGYNESVNRMQRDTLQPRGPLTGLLRVDDAPLGPPDPGFTPEEWKRLKKAGYAGDVSAGKDSACPVWIDYARASVRQALDADIDGLWVDNFSPWDSFGGNPLLKAFGEWSVAGFREYLRTNFSGAALRKMGIKEAVQFDVRQYLQARCREWGGNPESLNDKVWRLARWQDEPVWRAYLIYKRRIGAAALSKFYAAVKAEAAAAGKADFLVMGNDMPIYALGWVRGDLDMVSTELTWGWHLTTGPRGVLPPPVGSYVPVYRLGREMARSRFVNAWMYVPEAQLGKTNIARVLYYQGLANHALPMPNPGERTAGNPAADAEFFQFVRRVAPVFGDRVPIEEIGLFHSASSQLMEMLPGGFRDHAHQPHSFAFWGWGTALSQLHLPWRAIPEWKLTAETLRGIRVLILPSTEVLEAASVAILEQWVRGGGTLLVTGETGKRLGESENFELASRDSAVTKFLGDPLARSSRLRHLGKGSVWRDAEEPGLKFYKHEREREATLPVFRKIFMDAQLDLEGFAIQGASVPATAGLTLYRDRARLFVDVNNTNIDLEKDAIRPVGPVKFSIRLPVELQGKRVSARVFSPDQELSAKLTKINAERLEIELGNVTLYASIMIETAGKQ